MTAPRFVPSTLAFTALVTLVAACHTAADGDAAEVSSELATTSTAIKLLRWLNQWDVIAASDLDAACSDTEGRMAAGGDMTLVRYGANTKAVADFGVGPISVSAGGRFTMVHGSIGNGTRGVEAQYVDLDHYAVGHARAICRPLPGTGEPIPAVSQSPRGTLGGVSCGAINFPAAQAGGAMTSASDHLSAAILANAPFAPETRQGSLGVEELVFRPRGGPDAYYKVQVGDLTKHWVIEDGARYFIELVGVGADAAVTLRPKFGVTAANAYAILNMPNATALHIGDTPNAQVRIALTVLAPRAKTTFYYDILDGSLYVASLDANPMKLAADGTTACAPGTWMPGYPTGSTPPSSGGQINHWPFTKAYGPNAFTTPIE